MDGEYDPYEWLDDQDGFEVDLEVEEPWLDGEDWDEDGEGPCRVGELGSGYHVERPGSSGWIDDDEVA